MIYAITGAFVLLDMITGMIKAFKEKAFTSSVMREGLFHKCGSLLIVVLGVLIDYAQKFVDLGVNIPIAISVCVYIILMECGSIAENIGKINPALVPAKIKPYFSKLSERSDDK